MIRNSKCLVLEMKQDGRLPALGKHEAHPAHDWWYTSRGGGHQMYDEYEPPEIMSNGSIGYDRHEGTLNKWHCPGRD